MDKVPHGVADVDNWHLLKHLDEHGEDLTTWEADFVESLMKQLKAGHYLTNKQKTTMDNISESRL